LSNIHLKPGFTAPSGIDFTAKIGTVPSTPKRFYYLKDHLGSIRVVARLYLWYKYRRGLGPTKSGRINETGDIVSSDDGVYPAFSGNPWGMILAGRSSNSGFTNDKYKFTGKELDQETQYYHFGWRPYDGRIGRWLQLDPKSEKYPHLSPYVYVFNNPLRYTDPFGDTVNVDPELLKPVVDEEGNPIPYDQMTPEQQHRTDFQQWWEENKETIEALFGEGGKYETTTINFNLASMPYPKRSLSNLFGLFRRSKSLWSGYDALTSFGVRGSDPGTFYRGENPVGPLNMSLNDLVFNIWFNPERHLLPQNAAEHEWKYHVNLIFDHVKNNLIIPIGNAQHSLPVKEIK
jgi:RHS repeat-associated protein